MKSRYGWLVALVAMALLVAGCGPEMATPTPGDKEAAATATATLPAVEGPTAGVSSPADLPVDPSDWHVLGSADAPVTLVEYTDFQCPYCAKYVSETFPQILETYVRTGQVRYSFKHFPLSSIHPQAELAAEAAECAGEQGKFWEMHDVLFGNQDKWSGSQDAATVFEGFAADLGLDKAEFAACLTEDKYATKVAADQEEGIAQGVTGTPAFRINGASLSGAQAFSVFQRQIDYYLAGGQAPALEIPADSYRSVGQADAPVVVTEFSDYQCPACSQVEQEVIPELISRYVDTGKVRFIYREFPLSSLHTNAQKAAEAAVCAGEQGQYWAMHDKLFGSQAEWEAESVNLASIFEGYAKELGLDSDAFATCLASGEAALVVQGEQMAGEMLGVNATPYFFVGDLPIRGGLPIDSLGRIIDYVADGGSTPEIIPSGDDWHVLGNRQTAQAITVAFVDYANSQSAQHALEILPELTKQYVDSGQMLYILHPWSDEADSPGAQAAAAAECAGQQGKYWEMHDQLFEQQAAWTAAADAKELFAGYAESLGLNKDDLATCLDSEWAKLEVESGSVVGALYGVSSAPVFLFNNGTGQEGSPTLDEFTSVIDSILGQ